MESEQSGHTPRSGTEVKNGRSSANDGAPERLSCGKIQEEVRSCRVCSQTLKEEFS